MDDLAHRFEYHAPDDHKRIRHEEVRSYILYVARAIDERTSPGREQSLAITKLEEAMFWANAAIAREQG